MANKKTVTKEQLDKLLKKADNKISALISEGERWADYRKELMDYMSKFNQAANDGGTTPPGNPPPNPPGPIKG